MPETVAPHACFTLAVFSIHSSFRLPYVHVVGTGSP